MVRNRYDLALVASLDVSRIAIVGEYFHGMLGQLDHGPIIPPPARREECLS
jgi:hypothetical protein